MIEKIKNNPYKYVIILNLIGWGLFSFVDALEELFRQQLADIASAAGVVIPIIMAVIFIIGLIKGLGKDVSGKQKVLNIVYWMGCALVSTIVLTFLVVNGFYIPQRNNGWEDFLNGLEYPLMGMCWGIGCPIIFIIGYMIDWMIRKNKEE